MRVVSLLAAALLMAALADAKRGQIVTCSG